MVGGNVLGTEGLIRLTVVISGILLATFWYPLVYAKSVCAELAAKPRAAIEIKIEKRDDQITNSQLLEVVNVIRETSGLVQVHLKLPSKLFLNISYQGKEASASIGGSHLTIPYQRIEPWDHIRNKEREIPLMKNPRHTRTVIAHEVGHVIFGKNIHDVQDQVGSNLRAARDEYLNLLNPNYVSMGLEKQKLYYEVAVMSTARGRAYERKEFELSESYTPKMNERRARIDEIDKILPQDELQSFDTLAFRTGYEEFFSDVLAIAYTGNRRSIFSALYHMVDPSLRHWVRARDFTTPIDPKTWEVTEVHALLGPARTALFQIPGAAQLFKTDPGAFVAKVFQAICNDWLESSKNYLSFINMTPATKNERLIEHLKLVF